MTLNPDDDGKTFINVYSKGQTHLGRALSNFSPTPFKHSHYGHFASMEGYWYWIKTGKQHAHLKRLYGASAKSAGTKLVAVHDPDFQKTILEGIECKILQTPEIMKAFRSKKPIPLQHYYVYGTIEKKIVLKEEHRWQLDAIEALWAKVYADAHPEDALMLSSEPSPDTQQCALKPADADVH